MQRRPGTRTSPSERSEEGRSPGFRAVRSVEYQRDGGIGGASGPPRLGLTIGGRRCTQGRGYGPARCACRALPWALLGPPLRGFTSRARMILFCCNFTPRPAEQVARVHVTRFRRVGSQDHNDQLLTVSLATADQATTCRAGRARLDAVKSLNPEHSIRVTPDYISLVSTRTLDAASMLQGTGARAEIRVLHGVIAQRQQVSSAGQMLTVR